MIIPSCLRTRSHDLPGAGILHAGAGEGNVGPRVFLTVLFSIATILPALGADAQASPGANANAVVVQHAPDRAAVLGLARTYYEKASPQIEPDLLPEFARLVDWPVRFDGSGANPAKASDFTNSVAFLVGYTDARNFYLACAAASFTLDPANATGAGNFGAAIVSYGEDAVGAAPDGAQKDGQLKPYRNDAIAVYLYALSLSRAPGPVPGGGAVTLLVNLGNLYLDTGVPENARGQFEMALQIQPNSWPAHQGMAAYYLAVGRRDLAEKELKKRECWPASIRKVAETADKTDEKAAPRSRSPTAKRTWKPSSRNWRKSNRSRRPISSKSSTRAKRTSCGTSSGISPSKPPIRRRVSMISCSTGRSKHSASPMRGRPLSNGR